MYHWTFEHSSNTESIDLNENHIANLTEARISADQQSLVIEDQGHFLAENISSDLSKDQGFTVSFSLKQTGNYGSRHFQVILGHGNVTPSPEWFDGDDVL